MIETSTRLPAIQRLIEIKTVAEQVHFKISTSLSLSLNRIVTISPSQFKDDKPYSNQEINEIRDEWGNFVKSYILK
ncbi:hypothetical protein CsatB_020131 [Cannabis sativa]